MTHDKTDPFQYLAAIEAISRARAIGLPAQVQARPFWTGIGFQIAGKKLVAPITHIAEIIDPPPMTLIPRVMAWCKGLAQVRGELMAVVDLRAFLGFGPQRLRKQSRLMVIRQADWYAGLLVEEILGLQQFHLDETQLELTTEQENTPENQVEERLRPYCSGRLIHIDNDEPWPLMHMPTLMQSDAFIHIAQGRQRLHAVHDRRGY